LAPFWHQFATILVADLLGHFGVKIPQRSDQKQTVPLFGTILAPICHHFGTKWSLFGTILGFA
jgi:hypothetical protein